MAAKDGQSSLSGNPVQGAEMLEELMMARRSIRKYTGQPVPEAWIETILGGGLQAPSASNCQPVRFVRITSQTMRNDLNKALLDGHTELLDRNRAVNGGAKLRNRINAYRRYAEVMMAAPVLLAVGTVATEISFAGRLKAAGLLDHDPRQGHDGLITVGLALKAMLLKAQALGVGSCILTAPLVFIRDMASILGLPDVKIHCLLALGFSAETPPHVPRLPLDAVYKEL